MLILTKFLLTSAILASTALVQAIPAPIHEYEVRQVTKWNFQPMDSAVPIWTGPASRGDKQKDTTTTTSSIGTTTTSTSASGAPSDTADGPATVDNGGTTEENGGGDGKPPGVSERSYPAGSIIGS